jgi:hypothetical protein
LAAILGEIEPADGIGCIEARYALEVPPGAEGGALAPEHGHVGAVVLIELFERDHKRIGVHRIHGIASLGAAVHDGPHAARLFAAYDHTSSLLELPDEPLARLSWSAACCGRGRDP